MEGSNENVIEWLRGDKIAAISAPNKSRLKGKVLKLAEQFPDEVEIRARNKDGSIFAHVPVSFVTIRKPKQVSETQREAARENFKKARNIEQPEA